MSWLSLGCVLGLSVGLVMVARGATNDPVNAAAAKTGGPRTLEQLKFVDTFRAEGLKVGFYYCGPGEYAGRCGAPPVPKGKPDLRGMPPEAAGDGEFMKKQFTELLTNYGPIDLMWWDGFYRDDLKQVVRSLQPGCLIVVNNNHNAEQTDIIGFEMPIGASVPADNTTAAEACDVITSDPALRAWFWTEKEGAAGLKGLKSADAIVELLNTCNSRKANLLLNAGPDIHGLIPEYSVQRLTEVGRKLALKGRFR